MTEEFVSVTKSSKGKLIEVSVLSQTDQVAMVQYYDKTKGALRVTIPVDIIKDGKVYADDLESGIPYGIEWESLKVKPFTALEFAKAMRDEGIYTKEDITARRQNVIIAINRLSNVLLSDILSQL
jgi:hypothetical protein